MIIFNAEAARSISCSVAACGWHHRLPFITDFSTYFLSFCHSSCGLSPLRRVVSIRATGWVIYTMRQTKEHSTAHAVGCRVKWWYNTYIDVIWKMRQYMSPSYAMPPAPLSSCKSPVQLHSQGRGRIHNITWPNTVLLYGEVAWGTNQWCKGRRRQWQFWPSETVTRTWNWLEPQLVSTTTNWF